MDRRSWPWKKKSSDKAAEKTVLAVDPPAAPLVTAGSQGSQETAKKVNYVQISMESYSHMTEMEDEVKTLNEEVSTLSDQVKALNKEVSTLNEKLSAANSEMTTKENLVKQHAKVAEEAVSGWEKAEAEAAALKNQLESVTLSKLTAEDRASHLDGALKECMRQIRNVKEDHEKKLHDVILAKSIQCDKIKLELEARIVEFDQELRRSSAENAAISRSLQERSNMLMKISEEKSQAEAEIERLKENVMSCEREVSSLKYELHIASKEFEIRNEEKNMSVRSAEVANKQHLEGVKKIAKLEAECQRLRGLVRKKLPGPAALAQMKIEVESLGRDYGEPRLRRSPGQGPIPYAAPPPEISLDNVQQCHKETEFLTSRLLAMEEETKMLKEALAKRNSELQASRNTCAKTASKLRSLESQVRMLHQQKNFSMSNLEMPVEGFSSQNVSNPPSLTSMSEDGIDEEGSVAESWATALISELSHFKKERNVDKSNKTESVSHSEIMDDFLEMEKLACLSAESNGPTVSGSVIDKKTERDDQHTSADVTKGGNLQSDNERGLDSPDQVSSSEKTGERKLESDMNKVPLAELQSRISTIIESEAQDGDVGKILEHIKRAVQDMQYALSPDSVPSILDDHPTDVAQDQQHCPQNKSEAGESVSSLIQEGKPGSDVENIIDQELSFAISQVHDFILALGKEARAIHGMTPDEDELHKKVEEFSISVNKVLSHKISLDNLVLDLSHVLAKATEMSINLLGYKGNQVETNNSDCIDKVTLSEKKVVQDDSSREKLPNGCAHVSQSASNPDGEGSLSPGIDVNMTSCKFSFEDLEQLKLEKDNMATDLSRCTEELEHTKSQLHETEKLLTELKSQLASSEKSNSLAETQLKCMAESYKSLETRAKELETEVNLLRENNRALNDELQEEKQSHQETSAKCSSLQEQIERNESSSRTSSAEKEKSKQEREIAAAAEKLAECQETIFLLGRQLKSLRPPSEQLVSAYSGRHNEAFEDESLDPRSLFSSQDFDQADMENTSSSNGARAGPESPPDMLDSSSVCPSETESNLYLRSPINPRRPKHRPTKSSSSSSSSALTPEKHSRGFSRFFSTKSRSAQ